MKICEMIDLRKDGELIGVLRVYYEGSGDPVEGHEIVGLSIAGNSVGDIDPPPNKTVEGGEWTL